MAVQFDYSPYAIGGATRPDSFTRMVPEMQTGLSQMLQAADSEIGGGLQVYSGYRSPELQAKLFEDAVAKYGSVEAARKWVAPPGRSRHNTGQAADLKWNGVRIDQAPKEVQDWIKSNAPRFGLSVPMEWEPWQVEVADARSAQIAGGEATATDAAPVDDAFDLGAALDDLLGAPTGEPEAAPVDDVEQVNPLDVYRDATGLDLAASIDDLLGEPAEFDMGVQPPTVGMYTDEPPEGPDTRFSLDITRRIGGPMAEVAGAAARGVTGAGPSVAGQMLPEGTPGFVGRIADVGVAGLAGLGAVTTGAAGLVGDVAEAAGMSSNSAGMLARDLAAMPEAFAGSPAAFARAQAPARAVATARKAAPTPAPLGPGEFGEMARKAASGGVGSRTAAQRLAAEAKANPEALAAAERLGVDLPADVLSDHTQLKSAVGLTRSQAGSLAEADWRDTLVRTIDRADEVISEIGGSPDLSDISDKVYRSLDGTLKQLDSQAGTLYDQVDKLVPRGSQFQPRNIVKTLNGAITDLGGVDGLSAQERKLFNMVTGDQPVTYERLMREKRLIGRAIGNQSSPYNDADQALLKKLYGSIAEDQVANVERLAGPAARESLEIANGIYAKKKALEGTITDAFGNDLQGSVANKLRSAMSQGSKGDVAALNRVLQVVPKELRAEAIMSSISAISRQRTGGLGAGDGQPFGFAQYAQLYRGLRQNSKVYGAIAKELEPEQLRVMQDLFQMSKRITEARANVLPTGKANQALVQSMFAEGIVEKVLNSGPGRTTRTALGAAGGAAAGGNLGAAIGAGLAGSAVGKNRMEAASRLFRSQQFQKMMEEAATTGAVSPQAQRRLARSGAMKRWAKTAGINDPQAWIAATVGAGQVSQAQEAE